jgi:hypothetical protein
LFLPIPGCVAFSARCQEVSLHLDQLRSAIAPARQALLAHPIYQDLRRHDSLRTFMEYHVFAVWDFMSLLKTLQQRLCCVAVPWLPNPPSAGSRLVNEIVVAEETDEDGQGGYASHFDLYRRSMIGCGADTSKIDQLLARLRTGGDVRQAMIAIELPEPLVRFVSHTFEVIDSGDLCRIAATFTFGREDLLPGVFQKIVDELNSQAGGSLDDFRYYLLRHVELDGNEHGPMAARLIEELCADDDIKWRTAQQAALQALDARLSLWDAIHRAVLRPAEA